MKIVATIVGIFGLALLTALTGYYGFALVIKAVVSSEWGTVIVVAARAVALAAAGTAWWSLLMPTPCGPFIFVGLRFIREAINTLFPLAVVGGDVIGARLLVQFGLPASMAIASVLIDIFIQVVCLLIFVLAGLGILLTLTDTHQLAARTLVILAIGFQAVAGFFLVLNFGAFEPVVGWLTAFGERRQWTALNHAADLGSGLQKTWQNRRGLSASFFIHLVGVLFGATEVWIALAFMGHTVSFAEAVAIESIGQGSRAAAFVLPGGLGVQDGTLIAVSTAFGIPPQIALAMALIKRIPDLVLGLPALLAWQILEGRRLLSRRK